MYMSEKAKTCVIAIDAECKNGQTNRFNALIYDQSAIKELIEMGVVEHVVTGIIEYWVYHPEEL